MVLKPNIKLKTEIDSFRLDCNTQNLLQECKHSYSLSNKILNFFKVNCKLIFSSAPHRFSFEELYILSNKRKYYLIKSKKLDDSSNRKIWYQLNVNNRKNILEKIGQITWHKFNFLQKSYEYIFYIFMLNKNNYYINLGTKIAQKRNPNFLNHYLKAFFSQKITKKPNISKEKNEFCKIISHYFNKMSFTKNEKIIIEFSKNIFRIPFASNSPYKKVLFPESLLLKKSHLPKCFQIKNEKDPRLYSNRFLNDFYLWLSSILPNSQKYSKFHPRLTRTLLILINDPEKFDKAKRVIICHELAHHRLGHLNNDRSNFYQFFTCKKREKEADQQALYCTKKENGFEGANFLYSIFDKHIPLVAQLLLLPTHGSFKSRAKEKAVDRRMIADKKTTS